jgi:hypothetical protein
MAADAVLRNYRENKGLSLVTIKSPQLFYRKGKDPRTSGKVIEFNRPSIKVHEDERAGS